MSAFRDALKGAHVALTVCLAWMVEILCIAVFVLWGDVTDLTDRLNRANAELSARAVLPPSAGECVAWFFQTNVAAAKARICKGVK